MTRAVNTALAGAGGVLQVVQALTGSNTSTTSSSYVDANGFTASITPTSTSSKILILLDASYYIQADNSTRGGIQIVRDSTAVYTDDNAIGNGVNANVAINARAIMAYLDSPATTSAITYKVQIKRNQTAGTSYAFQINALTSNKSTITLMEIAG